VTNRFHEKEKGKSINPDPSWLLAMHHTVEQQNGIVSYVFFRITKEKLFSLFLSKDYSKNPITHHEKRLLDRTLCGKNGIAMQNILK
jgi:hypothetical protein